MKNEQFVTLTDHADVSVSGLLLTFPEALITQVVHAHDP